MAINNEPTIKPTTVTGIFTRFLTKTIPLAFDDSMSYYECLCALLNYLNETIVPDINNVNDGLSELQSFYLELQNYVNSYFENLDVQEEINNKLDDLVEDGTISTLLAPYIIDGGSPIFVSSTSEMTDFNRNYVLISTGNIYRYNGSSFVDTGYTYGVNDLLFTGVPTAITSNSQLADFNDAVPNRCYAISTQNLSNMPENIGGTLLTFNRNTTDTTIPSGYVQLYITSSTNNIYYRNYWNNMWYDWKKITKSSELDNFFQGVNSHSLTDFNNAIPNRCYLITTTNLSNMPVANGGCLFTFNKTNSTTAGYVQYYVTSQSKMYYRIYWNNAWGNWNHVMNDNDGNIFFQGVNPNTLTDFNNAIPNRCYLITATNLSNMPVANTGSLITFNRTQSPTDNGYIQYFITSTTNEIYYRIYWSNSWKNWKKVIDNNNIDEFIRNYASLSAFRNIGVIGDSYASGVVYSAQNTATNNYAISWPQIMARKNGVNAKNFSRGGLRADTWLTSQYGLSLLNSSDPQNLYITALGLNDATALDNNTITLGSIADIDINNPENNENTFYGNFGKIISAIKTKAPNAKIIISTIAYTRTNTHRTLNNAMIEIAELFDVPYIEPNNSSLFTSQYFINEILYGHPTVSGYSGMAQVYEKFINDCMVNNYEYFQNYTDDSMEL